MSTPAYSAPSWPITTTTVTVRSAIMDDVENSTEDLYGRLLALGKVRSLGKEGNVACGVFLCFIAAFSLCGNGLVVVVLGRFHQLRHKPHNILLLNMAISDILVSVAGYPFTTISAFKDRYIFGPAVCALQGFLTFLLAMVAMTSLVFLSLYRYVAVCKPWLKYKITPAVTRRFVMLTWAYSFLWTMPPLVGWSRYTLEQFGLACSVDWGSEREGDVLYVLCLVLFCYLLPIAFMACCYCRIATTAIGLRHVRGRTMDLAEASCHHNITYEVKLSGTCFLMVLFFTAIWSPYAFVSLWALHGEVPLWAAALPAIFAKLASTLNPYIYVLASPDFRRGLRMLTMVCGKNNVVTPHGKHRTRHCATYTIDRTKDDIYIGQHTVVIGKKQVDLF